MAEVSLSAQQTHHHEPTPQQKAANIKLGIWIYLASEVIIFGIFITAYAIFRASDADTVFHVREELGITLVSFNTFLLLSSSWAMVMGLRAIQNGNRRGLLGWIGLTALLGTAFIGLQYIEYIELAHAGIAINNTNDSIFAGFGMRFYTPTAFHGAHVIIGVIWALWVLWRGWRGHYSAENHIGVESFGLYWHFVDVVWILLFTLIYLV